MPEDQRNPERKRGFPQESKLYLSPLGLKAVGGEEGDKLPDGFLRLAGGPLVFQAVELIAREGKTVSRSIVPAASGAPRLQHAAPGASDRLELLLERLAAPRGALLGLADHRPIVMGVVNVTPDSFSDGDETAEAGAAIARARQFVAAGADIIDVGGESARPGSDPVPAEVQCERVLPVIRALAAEGVRVSVDTRQGSVMAAGLEAGAVMVNDISALTDDGEALGVVARSGAAVALMHMQGRPKTMQRAPRYDCALLDVFDYLEARIEACVAAGIGRERILADPGIGFGKTLDHNLEILRGLALYQGLGCLVLLGVSRKGFIAKLSAGEAPGHRLPGSLAAALFGLSQGVQVLRVHDVAETRQALAVWGALSE